MQYASGNNNIFKSGAAEEGAIFNSGDAFWEGDISKICTVANCKRAYGGYAVWENKIFVGFSNGILYESLAVFAVKMAFDRFVMGVMRINDYISKTGAGTECADADFGHTFGNEYVCKTVTQPKCVAADAGYAFGKGYIRQIGAIFKCIIPNGGYTLRDGYIAQTEAVGESIVPNAGQASGEHYACQPGTRGKCVILDVRYTIGQGDACQVSAIVERKCSNTGHTFGNGDFRIGSPISHQNVIFNYKIMRVFHIMTLCMDETLCQGLYFSV